MVRIIITYPQRFLQRAIKFPGYEGRNKEETAKA